MVAKNACFEKFDEAQVLRVTFGWCLTRLILGNLHKETVSDTYPTDEVMSCRVTKVRARDLRQQCLEET